MKWIVEFTANDKVAIDEYGSRVMAQENFKSGKRLLLNLADMTPELKVSGTLTETDDDGTNRLIAAFTHQK